MLLGGTFAPNLRHTRGLRRAQECRQLQKACTCPAPSSLLVTMRDAHVTAQLAEVLDSGTHIVGDVEVEDR